MFDSTLILKGCHFSLPIIPKIYYIDDNFVYKKYFKFTEQHKYNFTDENKYDINKLFGFSIGYHHNNSYRFG